MHKKRRITVTRGELEAIAQGVGCLLSDYSPRYWPIPGEALEALNKRLDKLTNEKE